LAAPWLEQYCNVMDRRGERLGGVYSCVRCQIELMPIGTEGVLACSACGGEFCDRAALESALQKARLSASSRPYARPVLSLTDPICYVPCPVCRELMIRRNFGVSSGVVVDVCSHHGVWFDRGELAQVLAFCASGALDEAVANAPARSTLTSPPPQTQSGVDALSVLEACAEILWFI
jgi:Zn-finger nucleic acid-binding protein